MSDLLINKSNLFLKRVEFHYNTELLEALNWDDESLDELLTFVNEMIKNKNPSLDDLLNQIESKWTFEVRTILENLFKAERSYLNLDTLRSDDVEN